MGKFSSTTAFRYYSLSKPPMYIPYFILSVKCFLFHLFPSLSTTILTTSTFSSIFPFFHFPCLLPMIFSTLKNHETCTQAIPIFRTVISQLLQYLHCHSEKHLNLLPKQSFLANPSLVLKDGQVTCDSPSPSS